ncbi:hypothetical protein ACYPKM_00405 [Pseudomonas aeruginosa]
MSRKRTNPYKEVHDWNNTVQVGASVEFRSFPSATPTIHKTATEASVVNDNMAILFLEGKSGYVSVASCTPVQA